MVKRQSKQSLRLLLILLALLPGLPFVLIAMGMTVVGFIPALSLHNTYYSLPAMLFGANEFPVEEFGLIPTGKGYLLGGILYLVIALLFFGLIQLAKQLRDSEDPQ